ncbi:MAG: SDR family NAD(P)-dependent oxidoreductase [Marinifilaceae bacterium]
MKCKTILITGASDGIGKETAKALAKQGHQIIIHGRNPQKTKQAYEEIKRESSNENIDYYIADFLSFAQIKTFSESIKQKYNHLDVLINNAGAQFTGKREITNEGHEKTMMINLFAPYFLTTLLLDLLTKSKSARVVTVSSAAHKMGGKPYLDDIELKEHYSMPKAYGLSKLYVIWIMRHFVKLMKQENINNITFNTVHPASAMSSLGRESTKSLGTKIIYYLWRPMMKSTAEGAASSIYTATSPELEYVTGKYYGLKGEEKPSDKYYSVQNEQIVWNYCEKISNKYL